MKDKGRFLGCLIGGAAGDALGYAVEFMREDEIFGQYGHNGIVDYELTRGAALISDDTQMTLFTATALCESNKTDSIDVIVDRVRLHYLDWYKTQNKRYPLKPGVYRSWLCDNPEMFAHRAPGGTCLSALEVGGRGSVAHPINNSKGCGGVMRVAPIGLFFAGSQRTVEEIAMVGAEAAAITHGHPLGWLPAAAIALIVHDVCENDVGIRDATLHALDTIDALWSRTTHCSEFRQIIEKAIELALGDEDDLTAIHALGEGWVGEEALAIAVYCAVRHESDFDKAIIAAVNHNGDSDSTGAITGNILGAKVGEAGIPAKYTERLELLDTIKSVGGILWEAT